jgi:hypothetical protein
MLHTFPCFLHVTPDHLRRDVLNSRKDLTRTREARTHSRNSFASTFNTGITNKPSRDYKRSFLAWWWSSRLNWKTRKDERKKGFHTHTHTHKGRQNCEKPLYELQNYDMNSEPPFSRAVAESLFLLLFFFFFTTVRERKKFKKHKQS